MVHYSHHFKWFFQQYFEKNERFTVIGLIGEVAICFVDVEMYFYLALGLSLQRNCPFYLNLLLY
jgi:hypothetical protein